MRLRLSVLLILDRFKMRMSRFLQRGLPTLLILGLLVWILAFMYLTHTAHAPKKPRELNSFLDRFTIRDVGEINQSNPIDFHVLKTKVAKVARAMYFAKKHVRGAKTSDLLKDAIELMETVLIDLQIDKQSIYERQTATPTSVCPEEYKGSTYGYPFFYKGFEVTNCNYGKSVSTLVTVIKMIQDNTTQDYVEGFVHSIKQTYEGVKVILGFKGSKVWNFKSDVKSVSMNGTGISSDGEFLNTILKYVQTPYVLVARNAEILTNDSRLERLIREIESMQVAVVAGAFRNTNGQWRKGCFQSLYRNFTLKYIEGYDESLHECIFCDYVAGPFLTNKETVQKYRLQSINENSGLFEEWFLQIKAAGHETVVCPDSMFHVQYTKNVQNDYSKLMSMLNLYKLYTVDGSIVTGNCKQLPNVFPKSTTLHPCTLEANANIVQTIMKLCEKTKIICELQEGTSLGAVKLGKVLPWERDGDLTFLSANYSVLQSLKGFFESNGFDFSDLGSQWCCADNRTAGGKFLIHKGQWNIELYGQHMMDSELLMASGIQPTKVLFHGQWTNVPRNPGLFVRNRYGREIYQHALHWMTTGGKTGWQTYKTNTFMACDTPNSNDCLDKFNADGDLPFGDFMP